MTGDKAFAYNRRRSGLTETDLDRSVPKERDVRSNGDREQAKRTELSRNVRVGLSSTGTKIINKDGEGTDGIVIGAVLALEDEPIKTASLARALRWSIMRTEMALHNLSLRIPLSGQMLARYDDSSVEVRPLFEALEEGRMIRTSEAALTDRGLSDTELAALFQLVHPGRGRTVAAITEPGMIGLVERGLAFEDAGRVRVTDFVRFSLIDEDRPQLPFAPAGISVR